MSSGELRGGVQEAARMLSTGWGLPGLTPRWRRAPYLELVACPDKSLHACHCSNFYDRLREVREFHRRFPDNDITEVRQWCPLLRHMSAISEHRHCVRGPPGQRPEALVPSLPSAVPTALNRVPTTIPPDLQSGYGHLH